MSGPAVKVKMDPPALGGDPENYDPLFAPGDIPLSAAETRPAPYLRFSKPPAPLNAEPHDHRHHSVLPWLVRVLDGGTVITASTLIAWIGSYLVPQAEVGPLVVANLVAALVFFLTLPNPRLPIMPFLDMSLQQIRFLAPPVLFAAMVEAGVFWSLGWGETPTLRATGAWLAAMTLGLAVTRSISTYALRHPTIERRLIRQIAIIGHDEHAFQIAELFRADTQKGISVVGVFADGARAPGQRSVDGSIASLIALSRVTNLHGIIIALPPAADNSKQIARLSWKLRSVLADVFVMPYMVQGPDVLLPMQSIGAMSVMVLQRRPLNEWQMIVKKILDLAIGGVAFLCFIPLFLVVAAAIKLDSPGPVLFRQPRRGFNNRQFTVFKFRSMYTNAADLMAVKQTSRDDPRVTRVGKWLRRLSIDETPQLINVLRGEMSLVGPRPHAPQTRVEGELLNDVIGEYVVRFQVKPGITGWAQVNGARGELVTTDDLRRRVAYDLEYIQQWSAWFDIKIMALTVIREIVSRHAF